MKASELAGALTELIGKHGDQEVLFDCGSIHAALSSVDVNREPGGEAFAFVVYQRMEDDERLAIVPGSGPEQP